ncbi:MAG: class I SAM-dependent methyltransferase [Planctomycetota bacterium]|jgi:SAM-dependent methyltransferase
MNDVSTERTHVPCDLCGADDPAELFIKKGFPHVRCRRCGLVYVTPRLPRIEEQQTGFYEDLICITQGFDAMEALEFSPQRLRKKRKEAASYLPFRKTGRLLDIGCGLGGFLKAASEEGWKPEGVEIVPEIATYAAKSFPVHATSLGNAPLEDGLFDVVRLNNVIEHLPSPREVVATSFRILRPGGLLIVSPPNFDSLSVAVCGAEWRYIAGDQHIYLFGPPTLRRLLEDGGFRVVSVRTRGAHISLKDRSGRAKPSRLSRLVRPVVAGLEGILDLASQFTWKGHRLMMWGERPGKR